MSDALTRFEVIGDLYYRRHHCLRPGKSEAMATGRDANSDENRARFEQWFAVTSFMDAIDRIAELEKEVNRLGGLLEAAEERIAAREC